MGVCVLSELGAQAQASRSDGASCFSKELSCLYCDFSVKTVYSLAYGVNVKLAIVNLNMTTCKVVIQKLLLG